MILVGLAGWGDHDELYPKGASTKDKLRQYSTHYPIVEVDSTFYAIQSAKRFARWEEETPASFQFIVKAYQGMTGHQRGSINEENMTAMYKAFRESLKPLIEAGKLTAALFQYPPWFDCTRENVRVLRETKQRMAGIPCALEFRHQSWFAADYKEKTLAFMEEENWIHSICDEPQAGLGSVPTVLYATHQEITMVRMHGRNVAGWSQASAPNWREVRYLYKYNNDELQQWKDQLQQLQEKTKQVCVIFNNNSGGDAAGNAKQLMKLLGLDTPEIPQQLDLF